MDILRLDYSEDLPENYSGIVEYKNIGMCYYLNGLFHREDGPVIIWKDGSKYWFINNKEITKEVNNWLSGETDIPPYEKWDNNTRLIFKLTFG